MVFGFSHAASLTPPWFKVLMIFMRLFILVHITGCLPPPAARTHPDPLPPIVPSPLSWRVFYPHLARCPRCLRCSRCSRRAGGWYAFSLPSIEGFGPLGGWLPNTELLTTSLAHRYLRALHWSIGTLTGLTDVAQPTSRLQGLYTILVEVVGIFYFAYIIGVFGAIDDRQSETPLQFQARIHYVNAALRQHRVPIALQKRVVNFFAYQHARCKGADELQLMRELPDMLHVDIMLHLFEGIVQQVPFFADCEEGFLSHLVKLLR